MKNTLHVGEGHRLYFLKKYGDIILINSICTVLQDKINIFISFLLHFNINHFYEQSIVGVCKYSMTKEIYINYRQNFKESS